MSKKAVQDVLQSVTRNRASIAAVLMTDSYIPNNRRYSPTLRVRTGVPKDLPLRAQSVCLTERPRSKYARETRSADIRYRHNQQFYPNQPQQELKPQRFRPKILVRQQNRKRIEKTPFSMSVQNLSIPMKYAVPARLTSKTHQSFEKIDNRTKSSNPSKQVDNKRLCATVGCGKETENKLLLQISEARQVSDFERILNSNAILRERADGHVWRGCRTLPPTAAVLPRPRSAYSLHAVSQTYHHLFRRHEEALQPLIDSYCQSLASDQNPNAPVSILQDDWFENLQKLSQFYDDDPALKQEIDKYNDQIVTEEIKSFAEHPKTSARTRNFNVNLTDLIELRVNGEGFSPVSQEFPDKEAEQELYEEKEWLSCIPSMSATDDRQDSQDTSNIDTLAQTLNQVQIDSDSKVPTITFSNCCDACVRGELPNNSDIAIHLAVPSGDSIDESRPPMM